MLLITESHSFYIQWILGITSHHIWTPPGRIIACRSNTVSAVVYLTEDRIIYCCSINDTNIPLSSTLPLPLASIVDIRIEYYDDTLYGRESRVLILVDNGELHRLGMYWRSNDKGGHSISSTTHVMMSDCTAIHCSGKVVMIGISKDDVHTLQVRSLMGVQEYDSPIGKIEGIHCSQGYVLLWNNTHIVIANMRGDRFVVVRVLEARDTLYAQILGSIMILDKVGNVTLVNLRDNIVCKFGPYRLVCRLLADSIVSGWVCYKANGEVDLVGESGCRSVSVDREIENPVISDISPIGAVRMCSIKSARKV